ncbi:MAG: MraY family glycosyltransferase, partial [Bacillota bacterium]|nr:MraY family glycosyltransferase [Bacillota bacterium]
MSYFIYFALASLLTFFLTPLTSKLAVRIGAVDVPDGVRKIHTRTTPYGGGIAMFFAFTLTFCVAIFHLDLEIDSKLIGLVVASVIMLAIGLLDDIKPISAKYKFLVQLAAASVLYVAGYKITHISSFTGIVDFELWSIPITLLWITGVTNTINLIDGLDGLAAGIAAIASTTVFIISFITGNIDAALFAAVLAGACVGFLPRNLNNRRKVFMGDAGAYFVGMILAVISMEGGLKSATFLTVVAPVLAVGIPIFDTAFAIVRRLFNGKPIGQPDRGHLHHRLVDFGISQKKTVLALYFINVVFGMGAVAIINGDIAYGAMFFVIAFILVLIPSFRTPSSTSGVSDIVLSKIPRKTDRP